MKIEAFDKVVHDGEAEAVAKVKNFVKDYTIKKLMELPKEDYVYGSGRKDTFCYRVTHELMCWGTLTANNDLEAGLNPALGEKNIALQRLYEFYVDFFRDESRFATLIDRIAYDLSYGNPELKQVLTNIYNNTPGYDGAMRKLQSYFRAFFGSDVFTKILISETFLCRTVLFSQFICLCNKIPLGTHKKPQFPVPNGHPTDKCYYN